MKALSIRQPWIWAFLHAGKDVENRGWRTAYRGPLLLHASKTFDMNGKQWIQQHMGIKVPGNLPRGGIVARGRLVNCVENMNSPWFFGPWGLVITEVEPVQFYHCVGRLGLFEAPDQGVLAL